MVKQNDKVMLDRNGDKMNKVKKAFTMAEVLITLAILAIIAAFIIPILIETTPNENRILYKKMFHEIATGVQNLINDNSKYAEPKAGFLTPMDETKGFCDEFVAMINTVGNVDCTASAAPSNGDKTGYNFITTNGAKLWGFGGTAFASGTGAGCTAEPKDGDTCYITVYIDTNGDAGPNRLATAGDYDADRFKMRLYASGKVATGPDTEFPIENEYMSSPTAIRDDQFN